MFRIVEGNKSHINHLKEIWQVCFGDEMEYIDFFFSECFPYTKSIVLVCDGVPVGAMYLMDVTANEYGLVKKGYYVYAVAVLPQYRGQGHFKAMHDALADYLISHNMFSILCPANEKLCTYYSGLGYVENSFVSEIISFPKSTNAKLNERELDSVEFKNRRNNFFGENSVLWEDAFLNYILLENTFCGGFNLILESEMQSYFVVGRNIGGTLCITESDVPDEKRQQITDFLCCSKNISQISWIVPPQSGHNKILRAMTYNLKKEGYYFNHILN